MGQSGSKEYMNKKKLQGGNRLQDGKPEKAIVQPYIEGASSADQDSTLKQYFNKNTNIIIDEDERGARFIKEIKKQLENDKFLLDEVYDLQKQHFNNNPEIVDGIRRDFEEYSKDNKMGKDKLFEYYGLQDLEDTELGDRFFEVVKNQVSTRKSGAHLNYAKFLKTASVLSQDNQNGRLLFIYQFFDNNLDGFVDKEEFKQTLMMFLEAMLHVKYEQNRQLEYCKMQILQSHERHVEQVVDEIVKEIFKDMTKTRFEYVMWQKWFRSEPGFVECLGFNPHALI